MITWHIWKPMTTTTVDGVASPVSYGEGSCVSSDTKPTGGIFNGSSLREMDTGTLFFFDAQAGTWREWG